MNRDRIITELKEVSGSAAFVTAPQLCRYMSLSPNTMRAMLADLPVIHGRYHIEDVADLIMREAVFRHG